MIKSLKLKNFQAHIDNTIEFSPGFNVIVGSTDSGKSSVIRALSFILFNSPWERNFVTTNQKNSMLDLEFNDFGISRIKGENNIITLRRNGNQQKFENFGSDIPFEVLKETNIKEYQLEDKEINLHIANQLDPLFLLFESPSVRARLLNKLSGIDMVDAILSDLNNDKRNLSSERKKIDLELNQIQLDLQKYKNIDKAKFILDDIEQEMLKIEELDKKILELEDLSLDVKKWKEQYTNIKEKNETVNKIDIDSFQQDLNKLSEFKMLEDLFNSLSAVELNTERVTTDLKEQNNKYKDYKEQYTDWLREQKKCPVCGSEISNKIIEKCVEEL